MAVLIFHGMIWLPTYSRFQISRRGCPSATVVGFLNNDSDPKPSQSYLILYHFIVTSHSALRWEKSGPWISPYVKKDDPRRVVSYLEHCEFAIIIDFWEIECCIRYFYVIIFNLILGWKGRGWTWKYINTCAISSTRSQHDFFVFLSVSLTDIVYFGVFRHKENLVSSKLYH